MQTSLYPSDGDDLLVLTFWIQTRYFLFYYFFLKWMEKLNIKYAAVVFHGSRDGYDVTSYIHWLRKNQIRFVEWQSISLKLFLKMAYDVHFLREFSNQKKRFHIGFSIAQNFRNLPNLFDHRAAFVQTLMQNGLVGKKFYMKTYGWQFVLVQETVKQSFE